MNQKYKVHPAAEAFPMMDAEQYEGLKNDIAVNGQNDSIVFWNEFLLDGRNRLKACEELGLEPETCELGADQDPVAYVMSANLHRRHLTTAQRSMAAAKLATLKNGSRASSNDEGAKRNVAAKLLHVSTASIDRAKYVRTNGSKELVQAVERGELNLNLAFNLTKAVPNEIEQTKLLSAGIDSVKTALIKNAG